MSAFAPADFAEAKLTFRPLKRSQIRRVSDSSSFGAKTRLSAASARKTASQGKPKPKKRAKKVSDGKLKKRVWKEFSIFIRTRRADEDGLVLCVTCGSQHHWKAVDAGHFLAGRYNSNLFDERGCNEQCKYCNGPRSSNAALYYKWMLANHGQDVIDELILQNDQTRKWLPGELQALLDHYRSINASNPLTKKTN